MCGWSRELEPQDCLLAGGLLAAIASGWVVGVGAAVGMFVATDWHYNSEVRLRVTCDDARGDRLAAGDRRTVMHPDRTSLELDATGYCKLLDPHQGFRENDAANGALMRRLVA